MIRPALMVALLFLGSRSPAEDVIHRGGIFDFEDGFTMHRPGLFADRDWDEVGAGWGYWGRNAVFQPPEHRYGHPSFNRNVFAPNVSSGRFSQEITMTSANGDALVWTTFRVPKGHRIRCSLDGITTSSKDPLQLWHAIGQGGPARFPPDSGDPRDAGLEWRAWDVAATDGRFATETVVARSDGETLTYYIWVRHEWATSAGATLCIDNLRVTDMGPAHPE